MEGMKKQGYILRYYLPVKPYFDGEYTKKRFDELLKFCHDTKTETVMFYVALHPDFYYMNDSVENAESVRAQMTPYIQRLRQAGISYQLNFQNLLGSNPTGADFRGEYAWRNLVDHKGRESEGCACPLCEKFRAQTAKRLKIWAETKPDVIWIDDDLRMHNHGTPILAARDGQSRYMDYYCFCDEHIRLFNERNGSCYDRESLVLELEQSGEPTVAREKYLDFLNDTVVETASWVEKTVHSVSPNTKIAQMTSMPDVHAAEGRKWEEFLPALCGEYTPITRPHFGPYREQEPREFVECYRMLAQSIAQISAAYKGDVEFCPEIENTRFTVWSKSAAATSYQLALSAFLGCQNITLSLYDLDGGAFFDEPLYKRMLEEEKTFLDKLAAIPFAKMPTCGIAIPTAQQSGRRYRLQEGESYDEIGGKKRYIEKYLLKIGVPCIYAHPASIKNQAVALDAFTVNFLTEAELTELLKNSVFLDGSGAAALLKRGFGKYVGIENMEKSECVANVEVIKTFARKDGTYIRIPSRAPFHCWYRLRIAKGAETLSEFIDPLGKASPAMIFFENELGGKVAVYAATEDWGDGFYNHYRAKFIKDVLQKLSPAMPRVDVCGSTLTAVKEGEDGTRYYFCANLAPDPTETLYIYGQKIKEKLVLYQSVVYRVKKGKIKRIGKTRGA